MTIENARSFLTATGLALFTPRPQIAAPAPSFVEAVLGATNATPTLEETAPARELLARLVAEGLAVPLNLLGVGSVVGQPSDAPDFIASAQVFSYIFTLRGDKAWKQPPQAVGPAKVSHLAIATYEALAQHGPTSAYDLVRELGKEVTEAAVLRALGELWMHLRVLPLPQLDGRATLWELASTRLNKQIKAGANAGQPTALSALISLYLGQSIVASEDEIESFLSPLAARSRVRDVLHALLAAQQLATVAIEGRTVLHVAGDPHAFFTEEMPRPVAPAEADGMAGVAAAGEAQQALPAESGDQGDTPASPQTESGSRIVKFKPRSKPTGDRELAKARPSKFASRPLGEKRKPFGEARKPFGEKRSFTPRDAKGRPPIRDGKRARPSGERRSFKPADGSASEGRPRFVRPERLDGKPDRERRPFVKREGSDSRPARKPFDRSAEDRAPRKFADRSSDSRPPRRAFDRGGDRPTARKPFDRSSDSRPPRKPFDRSSDSRSPRKPFDRSGPPRKAFDRGGERPAARKPFVRSDRFAPRGEASSRGDRDTRESKPKPFGKPKPFAKRAESDDRAKSGPGGFSGKRPFSKPGGRSFAGKPRGEGAGPGRPAGGAGKKFGGKSFGGAKFGPKKFGAKKPFGRPTGPRGTKPSRPQGDKEA